MARKKKGGFGKFIGSLGGNPYDRLMGQFDRTVKQHEDDEDELADQLDRFVRIARRRFDEGEIDDEEHDLLMEEVEDVHPTGKSYPRLGDSGDEFYDSDDIPDAPELRIGKDVDLDDLLSSSGSSQGSWGTSEYDEYRERMAAEFMRESNEAIASGDHEMVTAQDPGGGRVFADDEDEAKETKRKIMIEEGLIDEDEAEEESDDGIEVDEDGVEWWEDEEGQWWYRPPNEEDWYAYEE
jgi:hypothetical protein